jgi:hypothetical protein
MRCRARPKDLASDYLGRDDAIPGQDRATKERSFQELIDEAAERSRLQRGPRTVDPSLEIGVVSRELVAGLAERDRSAREQQIAAGQRDAEVQRAREQEKQQDMDRGR